MAETYTIDGDTVIVHEGFGSRHITTEVPDPLTREHAISIAARALNQHGYGDVEMTTTRYMERRANGQAYVIVWVRPQEGNETT